MHSSSNYFHITPLTLHLFYFISAWLYWLWRKYYKSYLLLLWNFLHTLTILLAKSICMFSWAFKWCFLGFFTKHEEQVLKTIYPICFIWSFSLTFWDSANNLSLHSQGDKMSRCQIYVTYILLLCSHYSEDI